MHPAPDEYQVIDLSHPLDISAPVYPGDPPLRRHTPATVHRDGYALSSWQVQFHTGTHVDAPAHFVEGAPLIDARGAADWIGPAMVLPASDAPVIRKEVLAEAPNWTRCRFLLFHTGRDQWYGQPEYYTHYPVIDTHLAELLADSDLTAIGLDTPSPDREPWPVHTALLNRHIGIIENMCNLGALPMGKMFTLVCVPLRIRAEASWVRPLALIPRESDEHL